MRAAIDLLLAGLACIVLAASAAADVSSWRPLQLDGAPVRWQRPADASGRITLTWRIVERAERFEGAINCQAIGEPGRLLAASRLGMSDFRKELHAALAMWQEAAAITFVEAPHGANAADISIGAQLVPSGRAFADVAYDRSQTGGAERAITRALVCLNPAAGWKVGFDGNLDVYDLRYTLAHEIGHAIGLDHPRARGPLMSFRYDERTARLQRGDIAGAVALYGPGQEPSLRYGELRLPGSQTFLAGAAMPLPAE